jgi:hypothetical protein
MDVHLSVTRKQFLGVEANPGPVSILEVQELDKGGSLLRMAKDKHLGDDAVK